MPPLNVRTEQAARSDPIPSVPPAVGTNVKPRRRAALRAVLAAVGLLILAAANGLAQTDELTAAGGKSYSSGGKSSFGGGGRSSFGGGGRSSFGSSSRPSGGTSVFSSR